jgi:7-carboxy-7-deazaguanine synthase
MRTYTVKEMFYTLQGEGANAGRPAVFVRFAGCNLWSGRELDRLAAICRFCDTDFVGTDGTDGGKYNAIDLAERAASLWPGGTLSRNQAFVVLTGGEPLLQVDRQLIAALHCNHFAIAVETNGTIPAPLSLDWITVSPKAGTELKVKKANELKLVYPQQGAEPHLFEQFNFEHFYLQPMDGPLRHEHTESAVQYCLRHPNWRLSLQTHKILGLR